LLASVPRARYPLAGTAGNAMPVKVTSFSVAKNRTHTPEIRGVMPANSTCPQWPVDFLSQTSRPYPAKTNPLISLVSPLQRDVSRVGCGTGIRPSWHGSHHEGQGRYLPFHRRPLRRWTLLVPENRPSLRALRLAVMPEKRAHESGSVRQPSLPQANHSSVQRVEGWVHLSPSLTS